MSDSVSLKEITDFAEALAKEAGELIRHERDQNTLRTDYKHQTELVTHADVMADEFITGAIRARFPNHRILSEETMPDLSQAESLDTPLWIIDPIDGTVNYAYGHPQVLVFAERNPGLCCVLTGDALMGEDESLRKRASQFFERLETQTRQALKEGEIRQGLRPRTSAARGADFVMVFVEGRIQRFVRSSFSRLPSADFDEAWGLVSESVWA